MLAQRLQSKDWYHRTIAQLFQETCRRKAHHTALVFKEQALSYAALYNEVQCLAHSLLELGIGRGDVISSLPSATPEFVSLYFASLQIGAIVNPLNLLWGPQELQGVLQRNAPKLVVTVDQQGSRDILALLHSALPDLQQRAGCVHSQLLPSLRQVVCVQRSSHGHSASGYMDFQSLLDPAREVDQAAMQRLIDQGSATDIQFMCQTSGTTSLSKTALWDHRPPLATAHFGARNLRIVESDRYINLAPLYHNSGIFALTLNLAYAGTTLYLMDGFQPLEALKTIDRHGCTCTFGFDAHWQGMRRVADFQHYRFSINKAILAGEPRSYDLVRSMCAPGATINNLYAQTENGPLVSLADHDCVNDSINKYTHGRPLPGVEVVIKDIETGQPVVQGQPGEICYRSPYLFRGYHQQAAETQRAFDAQGYFHSGDYGHLDNGYITYLGRLGGVVKSGGENVSTTKVNSQLLEIFSAHFDDVKTLGVEDAYWGAKVVSLVRPHPGHALPSTAELREVCKQRMASYEVPRHFLLWEGEWPVTAEGKIDFKRLQRHAQEHAVDA